MPFYGQAGSASPRRDPAGWARYGAQLSGSGAVVAVPPRRRRGAVVAGLTAVALLAGGLGAGLGVAFGGSGTNAAANGPTAPAGGRVRPPSGGTNGPSGSSSRSATSGGSNVIRNVANKVDPGVVDINVEDASAGPAAGTGMIMTPSGYVLTNNHVIDSSTNVQVTLYGRATSYPAEVVGYDAVDDVAVVKIEGLSGLPTVGFGNSSSVSVGDTVVAIGNALGQGGTPTVVSGSVTAVGRTISAGDEVTGTDETLHGLIQDDADIQPGDSGGPLADAAGAVIGMDTAAASAESGSTLGFAIPINQARAIASQIMAGRSGNGVTIGLAAFLGIDVSSSSSGSDSLGGSPFGVSGETGSSGKPPAGVLISQVVNGSPAAEAGLQAGDLITAIDGRATPNFTDLHEYIQSYRPGQQIKVVFVDETGVSHTVEVTLAGIPY